MFLSREGRDLGGAGTLGVPLGGTRRVGGLLGPGENARSWEALGEARPGQSSLSAGALRYRAWVGSEQADSKPASVHTGWESLRKHAEQADSKRASVHTGWESLRKHAEQANSKPASVHTVWESLRKHAEAAPASI